MTNHALEQLYGAPMSQFMNKSSIEDFFHQRQRKRLIDYYSRACSRDMKTSLLIFKNHDARERIVELKIRSIDNSDLLQATIIDVTEYKSHERQIRELVDQISTINEIVASVNSNLNKEQLVRIFFNQVGKIFGYDRACIVLCDIEGKELEIHLAQNTTEIDSRKAVGSVYRLFTEALSSCEPIEQNQPAIYKVANAFGLEIEKKYRSQMLIQLKTDEQLVGAVMLFSLKENALMKYHVTIFQEISHQIAIAFLKARLLHRLQQSLTNLSFLSKINESLSSSLDLDSVLKQVVEASHQMIQAKICTIHFVETGEKLTTNLNVGFEDSLIDQFKSQIQQVILNHKPLVVESIDYNSIQFFKNRAEIQNLGLKSLIILPVIANGKTIALLTVFLDKVHYFSEHEIEFLGMLADQAAIAIRNAGFYNQVEQTKNFLESIIHSSTHIIVTTDLDGNTTFFNHSACQLTGYSSEEVLNQPFFDRFVKNGRIIFTGLKQELITKTSLQTFDCEILDKNKQGISISWAFSPLINMQGEIIGTLGIGRTVSRKERMGKNISLPVKQNTEPYLART